MAGSSSGAVFQWGNKEAGTDSSYESMCYKGVWYNLCDCVFCKSGRKTPFVGKLMRLYEDEAGVRKVRIRWFFRPYELPVPVIKDLSKDIHNSNELFIALGNVKGVENENLVEVICGKAMVLCTARFGGNMTPLCVHIDSANYVFNRAYDVANQKVVKMVNIQNKQLVQKFANNPKWMRVVENMEVEELKSTTFEDSKPSTTMRNFDFIAKKRHLMRTSSMDSSVSQGKKFKGKETSINDQVQDTIDLKMIDLKTMFDYSLNENIINGVKCVSRQKAEGG